MVWQYAAAAGVKALGSYFGGKAKKKAAKEKAKLMREGILMRRGFQLDDLTRGGRELMSSIQAAEGATGARGSSGSFKEHEKSEVEKQAESRSRIMAGSELELKKVASGLRSEVKAAKLASTFGALDAAAGYYTSEYEASPTTLPEAAL
jgi:hypothetical protein